MKTKNISTKTLLLYNLSQNEIENPKVILKDFCLHNYLPAHLEQLKYWRNLLLSNKTYSRRNCPSDLFLQYRMTIKLLEAAWLLREKGRLNNFNPDESEKALREEFLSKEQQEFKFYPTVLSVEEIWNPGILFSKLFKQYKLTDYRRILQYWMSEALSPFCSDELLMKAEIIIVYENLQKLYEASWLVYERDNRTKEIQN
ncbi:hypothetical protein [Pedobacter sp. KBW06]|uniref:hypothetical protein n=1 Tax=Pedobacter sp. KBW06 TaxID=2153359 RepID=UPI000F5A8030|nr:hypothetical protein [Pedobacter sp. KBW06]